tara:strand:- start:139 stop:1365 length:1227 start_codon:yes stop_codon:yes gene_type:complete
MNLSKFLFLFATLVTLNTYSDVFEVFPLYETPAIDTKGDAADDPAIWINKEFPALSIIFATDKRSGIYAYDLRGKKITFSPAGNINNVDLRTLKLDYTTDNGVEKKDYTFLFGSNRSLNTIDLWIFFDEGINKKMRNRANLRYSNFSINEKPDFRIKSESNIYGICAGVHPKYGLIAFVTEDQGSNVEVYYLAANGLELLATLDNGGESEGCVFDDENLTLFISEENLRGNLKAHKFDEDFNLIGEPLFIDSREGNIVGDPEGVTVYKTDKNKGFIILSSQGDSKFNIYNRQQPYEFIKSFKISSTKDIDGVSDTDGIDAVSVNLNCDFDFERSTDDNSKSRIEEKEKNNEFWLNFLAEDNIKDKCDDYPNGILVVQDGYNYLGDKKENQNFKLISFKEILDNLDVTR